jgi:hypothetical protein
VRPCFVLTLFPMKDKDHPLSLKKYHPEFP